MLLKILGKKHVREILLLLNTHGELYFSQIHEYMPTHTSVLGRTLSELVKSGLITKRKEIVDNLSFVRSCYTLTDFGKKAVKLYGYAEQLEKELEEKHSININVNIGDNTIIANNSNINIKK